MILDNLDEIYQEVLEELSCEVGVINLRNKKHVDILSEILFPTTALNVSEVPLWLIPKS